MPNRLARETSPYLQQHADNPVDWFAWGDEALALALRQDRPILLSIGYSACHWCHVMAHECFEDAETAALMNRHFVNVKVDREERPDLDQIYQTALQLFARRPGGWPLTMFLTPQGRPFFGGTYFPKRSRHGLPGFDVVLQRVAQTWASQRAGAEAQAERLTRQLADTVVVRGDAGAPDADPLETAGDVAAASRDALMTSFDPHHGGFGRAPKFPRPSDLDALLRHAVARRDDAARDAALLTLERMAQGGLFDHLGGGFFRYSTDDRWLIPHFEKMLYDNGPLLRLYAQAWQLTGSPLFREVCERTAGWLMREMQSPEGGYFSSMDADSEGHEGRYYVWDREQVAGTLTADECAVFAPRYGLDAPPGFEDQAWHVHQARSLAEVAATLGRDEPACVALLDSARARLLAARDERVRPGRDDKVLTAWNALAIDGMAFAGRVLGQPAWIDSARRALEFVRRAMWRDGRLLATHKDGRSRLNAYLDDHAFLLGAVLEIMQAAPVRAEDVRWACALGNLLLDQFEDRRDGGFFFTSHDHEALVMRPKPGHDGATPSGNGAAVLHLQRLGHLVGQPRYLDAARRALELFAGDLRDMPHGHATLAVALAEHRSPPALVMLTGPQAARAHWRAAIEGRYRPGILVLQLPNCVAGLPPTLARPAAPHARAWICKGSQCLPPVDEPVRMIELLDAREA